METSFEGIWPILYAFFTAQDRLDRAAMRRQTEICVAGGGRGMAVLGLATEVAKLSTAERRAVVEWAAEDLDGRIPLAVTIFGATPEEQSEAVAHAAANGAALAILQPPRDPAMTEAALQRFFGRVMDRSPVTMAIQNAPEFLGIGLSPPAIAELSRRHGNFRVLKGEGPAVLMARVVAETEGRLAVFNGRGGLELPDNLRAGCAGLIPAPDCFEAQVRIYDAMRRGDAAEAERLYREILPAIVFVMQSIDHLICYGKRLVAARMGLAQVHDRAPGLAPTPFGEAAISRFAARLGPYGA
ncbi:dihydrodipicolinate synthase family protein [Limobrevibacterium gyesilva]|nr:dihydrodipicolinate synthase family protein [Limobrevibacterium gyesilva]